MPIQKTIRNISAFFVLMVVVAPAWSWRPAECVPPKFKNLKPAKEIEAGGELSFTASSGTMPGSIELVVKGYKVDLEVRDDYGYQVTGRLPEELKEGFALGNIKAHSRKADCITEKKWLFKIQPKEQKEDIPPVEEAESPGQDEPVSVEENSETQGE